MNKEQALQILTNVANLTITNGGILKTIDEASSVSMALHIIKQAIEEPIKND